MMVDAPSESAFVMWPVERTPPSAMTGTPWRRAKRATLKTAVACARPTAMTSCVVQMEPMPMPTRSPSTPASMSRRAWATVTTFPPTTSTDGWALLRCAIISSWYTESPFDESMTSTSTPASTRAAARSRSAGRVPIAAPTRRHLVTGCTVASG
eukprot:Amastigsp_a680949_59.p4 type:complete len:154 gc:universal Amastigsp_a680949_59:1214-753(-)